MQIHDDFSRRVALGPEEPGWTPSPLPGVERRMLDRVGGEVARATSVVRYAPGSRFDPHEHGLGEEFLVLEGVFSDEHGDYPAGTYVRNPPGSRHAPRSRPGCVLFVKLRQFDPSDTARVVVDTEAAAWKSGRGPGLTELPLHAHGAEEVRLVRFAPGAAAPRHEHPGGEEIYVLRGSLRDEHGVYQAGSWVRSPAGSAHQPASDEGCLLYVKSGHLPR
jgi:anti-sigma factor ChrR (cupin superfamily)